MEDSTEFINLVFGIRDAKGMNFQEVVMIDFLRALDLRLQKGWK